MAFDFCTVAIVSYEDINPVCDGPDEQPLDWVTSDSSYSTCSSDLVFFLIISNQDY